MTALEASPQMNYYAFNAFNASGLQTLMSGLESLMQNFTLSGRYGALNPFDITTRAALSNTTINATYSSFINQYSYEPRDLAIAYGLSIFWAVVCMILGAIAITQNRGSYTNSFSTIVRVTRDPELDRLIEEGEDRIGADPLPDHIAEAMVRFGERVGENAAKDDIAQQEWPEWI